MCIIKLFLEIFRAYLQEYHNNVGQHNFNYATDELLTLRWIYIGHEKYSFIHLIAFITTNSHLGTEAKYSISKRSLLKLFFWLRFVISHRLTVNKEPI